MAESDLEKGAEFTQIFNKHGGEEDPVIAAQRFLNIFRQLHIFTAAKRKEFDELIIKQPASVKGMFASLPGGSVLQEYVNNLEQNAGMERTKAVLSPSTPEISDEISKAKILASALAEAQVQIHPSAVVSGGASSEEITKVATQLRREISTLKQDVEEIRDIKTIDLSKLSSETLNKIQQSIERKYEKGSALSEPLKVTADESLKNDLVQIITQAIKTNAEVQKANASGPIKIVADESLKNDLIQIITQALKTNSEAQKAGNKELAQIISDSQRKMAEMLAASGPRMMEYPTEADEDGSGATFSSDNIVSAMPAYHVDKLENVIATVLKETNMSSTQMIIDVLQSFQQENMRILEMQTELQKALLNVSKSIQMTGCMVSAQDDLDLEKIEDLEDGAPIPALLPEQKEQLSAAAEKAETTQAANAQASAGNAENKEAPRPLPPENKETSEHSAIQNAEEPVDDGVLTADDLFADLDGENRRSEAAKEEAKKKKKKKKKNKNKQSELQQPLAAPGTVGAAPTTAATNPAVNANPVTRAVQPQPTARRQNFPIPNPLFTMPMPDIPDESDDIADDASGWGFSDDEQKAPAEENASPQDFSDESNNTPAETVQNAFSKAPAAIQEAAGFYAAAYGEESAEDEGEWVYENDDSYENAADDGSEEEWEYVEDTSETENQEAATGYEDETGEGEWEWEYVDEDDNAQTAEENSNAGENTDGSENNAEGEQEWEYVEDGGDDDGWEWEYVDDEAEQSSDTDTEAAEGSSSSDDAAVSDADDVPFEAPDENEFFVTNEEPEADSVSSSGDDINNEEDAASSSDVQQEEASTEIETASEENAGSNESGTLSTEDDFSFETPEIKGFSEKINDADTIEPFDINIARLPEDTAEKAASDEAEIPEPEAKNGENTEENKEGAEDEDSLKTEDMPDFTISTPAASSDDPFMV